MKTTIRFTAQEHLTGYTLTPYGRRNPTQHHLDAWGLVTNRPPHWEPVEINCPDHDQAEVLLLGPGEQWQKESLARYDRVARTRKFKTNVKVLEYCALGPIRWAVTVDWSRPVVPPVPACDRETPGIWTLYRIDNKTGRKTVLKRIPQTLECLGDDLYQHLDIPAGWEVFPDDVTEIPVCAPTQEEHDKCGHYFLFKFRPTKRVRK